MDMRRVGFLICVFILFAYSVSAGSVIVKNGEINFTDALYSSSGSVFNVNNSTGRVGIGTAAPVRVLTIIPSNSAEVTTLAIRESDDSADIVQIGNVGSDDGSIRLINSDSLVTHHLRADGGNNYVQNGGGNFGIGTTSPIALLDVGDVSENSTMGLRASASYTNVLTVQDSSAENMLQISGSPTASDTFIQLGDIGGVGSGPLFSLKESESEFTFENGDVGIGLVDPAEPLHVYESTSGNNQGLLVEYNTSDGQSGAAAMKSLYTTNQANFARNGPNANLWLETVVGPSDGGHDIYGIYSVLNSSTGSVTDSGYRGAWIEADAGASYGWEVQGVRVLVDGTGTARRKYGLDIDVSGDADFDSGGFGRGIDIRLNTTAPNNYLIYGTVSQGTTDYGLYLTGADIHYLTGDVGVGTVSPSATLDVVGEATIGQTSGAGSNTLYATGAGGLAIGYVTSISGDTNSIDASGNGSFAHGYTRSTNGAESGAINASGQGALAGGYIVLSDNSGEGIYATNEGSFAHGYTSGGYITSSGDGSLAVGEATGEGQLTSSGGGAVAIGYVDSTGSLLSSGIGSLALGFSNEATFQATNNGAVAIGYADVGTLSSTSTGSVAIGHVGDSGTLSATNTGSIALGYAEADSTITSSGAGSVALGYASGSNTLQSSGGGSVAIGENVIASANNAVAIGDGFTNANDNSAAIGFDASPMFFVDETGVGINNVVPGETLDVNGNINVSSSFDICIDGGPCVSNITDGNVDGSGTANYVAKWTDGDSIGNSIIYDNGSHVGIGEITPDAGLHVGQGGFLIDSSHFSYTNSTGFSSTGTDGCTFGYNSRGVIACYEESVELQDIVFQAQDIVFTTRNAGIGDTEVRMIVDNGGNIGIGTENPTYDLDVYDSSDSARIMARGDGQAAVVWANGTAGVLYASDQDAATDEKHYQWRSDSGLMSLRLVNDAILGFIDNNLIVVNGSSNLVGIGVSNPLDPLHILTDSGGDAIHLEENSGGEDWQIGVDSGGDLNFEDEGTNRVTFEDGGNVGIGTSNPNYDLHIDSTNSQLIYIEDSALPASMTFGNGFGDGWGSIKANLDGGQQWVIGIDEEDASGGTLVGFGTLTADPIIFYTDQSEAMRIDSGGEVGIGDNNPDELLKLYRNSNDGAIIDIENPTNGTGAFAAVRFDSDVADAYILAHSSGRTGVSRYGQTVGDWFEILHQNGNGLMIGTGTSTNPVILGSNNTEVLRITPEGKVSIGREDPIAKLHLMDGSNQSEFGTIIRVDNNFSGNDGDPHGLVIVNYLSGNVTANTAYTRGIYTPTIFRGSMASGTAETMGIYAIGGAQTGSISGGTARFYGGYFADSLSSTISGSPIVEFYGVRSQLNDNLGTTGTTTKYGIHSVNTGTADTSYAVYASASGSTTNYGVYSAAGENYFAADTEIAGDLQGDSCAFAKTGTFWAEESSTLSTATSGGLQFSFGNGEVGLHGQIQPCDGEVVWFGMSCVASSSTTGKVQIAIDGTAQGTGCQVSAPGSANGNSVDTSCAVSFSAGDQITAITTTTDATADGCVPTWIVQYD